MSIHGWSNAAEVDPQIRPPRSSYSGSSAVVGAEASDMVGSSGSRKSGIAERLAEE